MKNITLFSIVIVHILFLISGSGIAQEINCNPEIIIEHPIDKCSKKFLNILSTLDKENVAVFEKELRSLNSNKIHYYEDYMYLFKYYPSALVLFYLIQAGEENEKKLAENKLLRFDDPEDISLSEKINNINNYQIVITMLQNKNNLSSEETNIINISKQRSSCLQEILDYLELNSNNSINSQDIITKCYL